MTNLPVWHKGHLPSGHLSLLNFVYLETKPTISVARAWSIWSLVNMPYTYDNSLKIGGDPRTLFVALRKMVDQLDQVVQIDTNTGLPTLVDLMPSHDPGGWIIHSILVDHHDPPDPAMIQLNIGGWIIVFSLVSGVYDPHDPPNL